jgi:hypothetical protein
MNPLQALETLEVTPTQAGVIRALQDLDTVEPNDLQLVNRISTIVGEENAPENLEGRDLKTFYKYLLQNTVKHQVSAPEDIGTLLLMTAQDVDKFNSNFDWVQEATEKVVNEHKRTNKVTKKDQAVAIFAEHYGKLRPKDIKHMFMDQLDMSQLGASTYYYNLKKEFDAKSNQEETK